MLESIHRDIISCKRCPRLLKHCQSIAREKRKAYAQETYWGKPVPGFGDPKARLIIVGLAPAAHGANRTGRIFTGDRSGEWLYRALHKQGFANQPTSLHKNDGLKLKDAYITCIAHCAPPDNKPTPKEIQNCSAHLQSEWNTLASQTQVVLVLGQLALNGLWPFLKAPGPKPKFGHGATHELPDGKLLLMSYHPSQQNTFTGRLTEPMFDSVFIQARKRLL